MEIKFDLNLEDIYLDEDGTTLKQTIQNKIIEMAVTTLYEKLKTSYQDKINGIIQKKIEGLVEDTFLNFINREITVTDEYGDPKEKGTVRGIIKNRFEEWLEEKVDKNGNISVYDAKYTRITFLIEEELKKHSCGFINEAVNAVANKLEQTLSEDLRNAIGQKIADKIGLNKLLPKMLKK